MIVYAVIYRNEWTEAFRVEDIFDSEEKAYESIEENREIMSPEIWEEERHHYHVRPFMVK